MSLPCSAKENIKNGVMRATLNNHSVISLCPEVRASLAYPSIPTVLMTATAKLLSALDIRTELSRELEGILLYSFYHRG